MTAWQVGNYNLDCLLGSGGMGKVYKAFDTHRERYVALKLLPEALGSDQEYIKRFQRESNVAARLRDPHVIPIHDFGEIDGRLFIDMRLVDGADIGALLDTHGRIVPQRAVNLIGQVAEALDAAHADHLVHRDIKPSNILITANDFVYVVDFGIARSMGGHQTSLTITGTTINNAILPESVGTYIQGNIVIGPGSSLTIGGNIVNGMYVEGSISGFSRFLIHTSSVPTSPPVLSPPVPTTAPPFEVNALQGVTP